MRPCLRIKRQSWRHSSGAALAGTWKVLGSIPVPQKDFTHLHAAHIWAHTCTYVPIHTDGQAGVRYHCSPIGGKKKKKSHCTGNTMLRSRTILLPLKHICGVHLPTKWPAICFLLSQCLEFLQVLTGNLWPAGCVPCYSQFLVQ